MRHNPPPDSGKDISQVRRTFFPLCSSLTGRHTAQISFLGLVFRSAAGDGANKAASGWLPGLGVNCSPTSVYNLRAGWGVASLGDPLNPTIWPGPQAPGDKGAEPKSTGVAAAPGAPLTLRAVVGIRCHRIPPHTSWKHPYSRGLLPPRTFGSSLPCQPGLIPSSGRSFRYRREREDGYYSRWLFQVNATMKILFLFLNYFLVYVFLLLLLLLYMVVSWEIISIWISGKIIFYFL